MTIQTRLLLVDDHAVVRQGLRTLLESAGYAIVGDADNGERASTLWLELQPDVMLLDLDMPGIGGLVTLQRILARDPAARVLVFSMYDDTVHAMRAIQYGARGYVVKSDAPEIMLDAVRQIVRGGRYIGREVAQQLAMERLSGDSNPLGALTRREFEVFRRLAAGESLAEIARHLHIGYKTAANLQTLVRQKLNVRSTGQLIHLALRLGVSTQQ